MSEVTEAGAPAGDWEPVFQRAGVLADVLREARSRKAKVTRIGQYLAPYVGREVAVQVSGRGGKAVLRVREGRSREKRYFFEVTLDGPADPAPAGPSPAPAGPPVPEPRELPARDPAPPTVPAPGGNDEEWS